VPVKGIVLRGSTTSMQIEIITEEDIDLVVMATHGTNALDARWEGSLTPRFLPKTPVPVILVHGTEGDTK
jgi:nucleotide-binding universal stress UspA family protein